MPIYEYSCGQCEKLSDVLQKIGDPAPARCEHCGAEGQLTRVVSRTSFVLQGGGWYSDLYGSTKKEASASTSPGGASKESSTATPAPAAAAPAAGASTSSTAPAPAAAPAGKPDKK
jgi:putative FmdB family regulatory protein